MNKSKTVEEYINTAPQEVQNKLIEIQKVIKSVAPNATEKISYGMPSYYGKAGMRKGFTSFAYFKDHLGIFATPGVLDDLGDEIKDLRTGKATLRFPLDKNLPITLIKKVVRMSILNK